MTYDANLNPFVAPKVCKVNCATAPCTFPSCQNNVASATFAGAEIGRGGSFNSTYNVLGVTPIQNGTVNNNGLYSANCRGAGAANKCYFWASAINTGYRELRFVIQVTPTSTPTPGPGPWVKLKDSSFSSVNDLNNNIPPSPVAYDSDDTGQAYFIVGQSGVVEAPQVNVNATNPTAKTGNPEYKANNYTPVFSMTATNFVNYVKARKSHNETDTLANVGQYGDGIYIYTGGDLTLTSVPTAFDQYNIVMITDGNVTIDMQHFTPSKSVAIMAASITFTSQVQDATGVFVAGTALKLATCDGPPYYYKVAYEEAEIMLERLKV